MPSPEHKAYRGRLLRWCRAHAADPDVVAQLERHKEIVALLWELDLEPARPYLAGCYAPNPRGGDPWDPIVMLRSLLLMALVGQTSINKWVPDLGASRALRAVAGLSDDRPGVGTHYDFLARLHNGPIRTACEHQERPADAERRRAADPRPLQRTERPPAPTKENKPDKKQRKRDKAAIEAAVAEPNVTEKLIAELQPREAHANPNDLLARLAGILREVGVKGSAARGLLGDVTKLAVSGDGSCLRTGASGYGRRVCDHPKTKRCDCARIYSDPDARFGYDSYNETFFFGHRLYEISVSVGGHDLPLAVRLDPGNGSDYTASVLALDRLLKELPAMGMAIAYFIADAGHDGEANYRYCMRRGIRPVIPLRGKAPAFHPVRTDIALSPRGVPKCEANVEMAPNGSAGPNRRVFVCPVKDGTLKRCPLAPDNDPGWLCRPQQKHAPVVAVDVRWNPRLCPPVPRNSKTYTTLYKLRSGCERSNSVKKETFKLEDARHRRSSFWLIRLHLIAVLQHARAWVPDGAGKAVVDYLLGRGLVPADQPA